MLTELGKKARAAAGALTTATTAQKNNALCEISRALVENASYIIEKNKVDLKKGKTAGLSEGLLDRLMLDEDRIKAIAESCVSVSCLDDPCGRVLETVTRPNGRMLLQMPPAFA